ncbi:zinc finger Y-chromosomal protein 1-like [Epargyreus clarus]|uniref:zinc finger Y-chromosomal protein 1-like n=1 Tax=Epargyreus clarus TaxID=520877 RepID=UPI003C309805
MSALCINICQTCLSKDRTLYPMFKLQTILEELHFFQLINTMGGICWECKQQVRNIWKFKNQVIQAQNVLCNNLESKYIGSMSLKTKNDFDYQFYYEQDPLLHTENVTTNKLNVIKEEEIRRVENNENIPKFEIPNCDDSISSCAEDVKVGFKEEIDGINYCDFEKSELKNDKNGVLGKVKKKNSRPPKITKDSEEDILEEKYKIIVFTEEEMLRNREEKRRQPNFKKIPFKCDHCVLGFKNKENYDLHVKNKHDESIGPHACPVCSTRFASLPALRRHLCAHYRRYACRLCAHRTRRRGAAHSHAARKHAADTRGNIHCARCEHVARTPEELSEHMRTQHILYCNECGEKFKGKDTLRKHETRIHKSKRDFICDICKKTFKTKSRLESHMSSHAASLARQLAYCGECGVQYKNIHVYRHHLRNSKNHAERVHKCPDCNKMFASKVYFRKHCNFFHLKKSPFKCEICDKLFISDWLLKNHIETHHSANRKRNHTCTECGKKFYTQSTLRAHYLTHSSERTYMCEQCGDTFKQRAALHTHTRALHAQTQ